MDKPTTYLEVREVLPSDYRNALDLYMADYYSRAKSKSALGITADDVAVKYYERVMRESNE